MKVASKIKPINDAKFMIADAQDIALQDTNVEDKIINIATQNYTKQFSKIKSVNMYVPYNEEEYGDYKALIDKAIEVNCNYISFCPKLQTETVTSNTITIAYNDTILSSYVDYATEKGLKIIIKPHITTKDGQSGSSSKKPTDLTTWINSLQDNLLHLINLLGNKIQILSITNECSNQTNQNESDWSSLISAIKSTNSKILLTTATTDTEISTTLLYKYVDIISCNLYIGLTGTVNTPITELRKSVFKDCKYKKDFISLLLDKSQYYKKPILITEVGCLPYDESLNNPSRWDYPNTTPVDENVQCVYFETVLPFYMNSKNILGCSIWSLTDNYTFNNRKAENILKQIYRGEYYV